MSTESNTLKAKGYEITLLGALIDSHVQKTDGNFVAFAARTGVSRQIFTSIRAGSVVSNRQIEVLESELGLSEDAIRQLAKISVPEACDLILSHPEKAETGGEQVTTLDKNAVSFTELCATFGNMWEQLNAGVTIQVNVTPTEPSP